MKEEFKASVAYNNTRLAGECNDNKLFLSKLFSYFKGDNETALNIQYEGIMRYIPLIICGGFFVFTIVLFAFGPLDWHIENRIKLYAFLSACVLMLTAGYICGVVCGKTSTEKVRININKLHILCAIVFFLLYIPTVYTRTGKFYPDVYTGLMNAGLAYQTSKYFADFGSQTFQYIRIVLGAFLAMVLPVTLFFLPKLSKTGKILGISAIILTIFLGISQGVNKYCADITAQIIIFLTLLFFSKKEAGKNLKHKVKTLLLIAVVCGLFFGYYTMTMRSRVAMDSYVDSQTVLDKKEISDSIDQYSTMSFATKKEDYFPFRLLPDSIESSGLFLSSYFTHGYKGLSIAMDQEFSSTYGLGFSQFFRHNFLKLFGDSKLEQSIENRTYANKTIVKGWETGKVWSSFFIFPASDITFLGTILLVFIIGYIWAISWKDALKTHNPFAVVFFLNLCIMVIYFSANNQLFQGGESFIGVTAVLFAWLITRRRAMKKGKTI